jgi:hypothetical protein
MTMSQEQSTSAKNEYYNCMNVSAVRNFDASPELIYDRLLKLESTKVCFSVRRWFSLLNYNGRCEITPGVFLASPLHLLRYLRWVTFSCCTAHLLIIISYPCTAKVHPDLTSRTTRRRLISTCHPSTAQMRWRQAAYE